MTTDLKIGWACITLNRLAELQLVVRRMSGHVDRLIVVDGGSQDETILWCRGRKDVDLIVKPWPDNFSQQRNVYLNRARELGLDWLCISDTDELYSEVTVRDLRTLIEFGEGVGFGGFQLRCEEVALAGDEEIGRKNPLGEAAFYKHLIVRLTPSLHYVGNPHEGFRWGPSEQRAAMKAPEKFFYEHRKPLGCVAQRGARNFFIAGGGDNERPAKWQQFRLLCDRMGIVSWPAFNDRLIRGDLPASLKEWVLQHRHDSERPGDSEVREVYLTYFRIFHPEQDPFPLEHVSGQECSLA